MIAVTARKLVVRFGDVVALDHIDLEVRAGELLLLLGPSGCGKSTLLRSIAGFVVPDGGTLHFGEEEVTHLAPHQRNTGMVFQSFALWPHLSVQQNVAFGLRERRVDKGEIARRVRESLDAVRMGDRAERRIDQLSGGEQQRVALARALVIRPRCLLLDEPLSNLDASLRHSMRDEIRRVCKEFQLTAVYVTHDQKEALAVGDRIAVMKGGKILQIGTPLEVYRQPSSRAVAAFIGETNLLAGIVKTSATGEVRVGTAVGELVAEGRPGLDFRTGTPVWVSLRPECFSLTNRGPPPLNALPGAIESTAYLGEIAEHRFRAGGEVLRIYELNPQTSICPASASFAVIAPADVTLVPNDDDR